MIARCGRSSDISLLSSLTYLQSVLCINKPSQLTRGAESPLSGHARSHLYNFTRYSAETVAYHLYRLICPIYRATLRYTSSIAAAATYFVCKRLSTVFIYPVQTPAADVS